MKFVKNVKKKELISTVKATLTTKGKGGGAIMEGKFYIYRPGGILR